MKPESRDEVRVASRSEVLILALLFLVSFVNFLDRHMLGILLPAIKASLRLSDSQLGLMAGPAFSLLYAVMGIPFGRVADRVSPRRVMAGALAFWSAMTALCGVTQGFAQLLAGRVLVGVGEAGATPAANALIARLVPAHRRGRALSIFAMGLPAGLFVGFLGGGVLTQALGWRMTLLVFGGPGLLLAAVILWLVPETSRKPDFNAGSLKDVLRTIFGRPSFRQLCLGSAMFTLAWQGMIVWLPSYFTRAYHLTLSEVGAKLALVLAGSQALGLLAGGAVADRSGGRDPRWTLWTCAAASLAPIPLFAIVFAGQLGAEAALGVLFAALTVGVVQGVPALACVHAVTSRDARGVAVAAYLVVVNVIAGFGALLIGFIGDHLTGGHEGAGLGRAMLYVAAPFGIWSALHFWLASRSVAADAAGA